MDQKIFHFKIQWIKCKTSFLQVAQHNRALKTLNAGGDMIAFSLLLLSPTVRSLLCSN